MDKTKQYKMLASIPHPSFTHLDEYINISMILVSLFLETGAKFLMHSLICICVRSLQNKVAKMCKVTLYDAEIITLEARVTKSKT